MAVYSWAYGLHHFTNDLFWGLKKYNRYLDLPQKYTITAGAITYEVEKNESNI